MTLGAALKGLEEAIRSPVREARLRELKTSKPWQRLSVDVFERGRYQPPMGLIRATPGGVKSHGFREWKPYPPPSLSDAQAAEVAKRATAARASLKPAGKEALFAMLLQLAAVMVLPGNAAWDTMAEVYAEDLALLPTDLLDGACKHWRRTEKFFPGISDLLALVQSKYRRRLEHCQVLARLEAVAQYPAPDCEITDKWLDSIYRYEMAQLTAPSKPVLNVARGKRIAA